MYLKIIHCCCSIVLNSLRPHGLQHVRLPCPSLFPGVIYLFIQNLNLALLIYFQCHFLEMNHGNFRSLKSSFLAIQYFLEFDDWCSGGDEAHCMIPLKFTLLQSNSFFWEVIQNMESGEEEHKTLCPYFTNWFGLRVSYRILVTQYTEFRGHFA